MNFFEVLIARLQSETTKFFKVIAWIGGIIGTLGLGITTAPPGIELPELIQEIGSHLASAGYIMCLVANMATTDRTLQKK